MSEFQYRPADDVLVADDEGALSDWVITHAAKLWDGKIVYTMREYNEATLRTKHFSIYETDLKPWDASEPFGGYDGEIPYVASLDMRRLGDDRKESKLDVWLGT